MEIFALFYLVGVVQLVLVYLLVLYASGMLALAFSAYRKLSLPNFSRLSCWSQLTIGLAIGMGAFVFEFLPDEWQPGLFWFARALYVASLVLGILARRELASSPNRMLEGKKMANRSIGLAGFYILLSGLVIWTELNVDQV